MGAMSGSAGSSSREEKEHTHKRARARPTRSGPCRTKSLDIGPNGL